MFSVVMFIRTCSAVIMRPFAKVSILAKAVVLMLLLAAGPAGAMDIFVDTPANGRLTLDVEASDQIEYVKTKIQDLTGDSPGRQWLFFDARLLEEGRTLADYNIQKNSVLLLTYGALPFSGPWPGGHTVTIFGTNLCAGGDVTNVTLCGVSVASIESANATQVVATAGSGPMGGTNGDVVVWSESLGATLYTNAYTYHPAGEIGAPEAMMEYRISFTGRAMFTTTQDVWLGIQYPTNRPPDAPAGAVYTCVDVSNDWVQMAWTNWPDPVKNDVWIKTFGFQNAHVGGWNAMAGGLWWIATNAAQHFIYNTNDNPHPTNPALSWVVITNLPGTNYDVEVVNSFGGFATRYNETLSPGHLATNDSPGTNWGKNVWGGWQNPGGGGNWFNATNTYYWRDRYIVWSNFVPQNGAMTLSLWDTNVAPCNILNCMRIRGVEPVGKPVNPPQGLRSGGYQVTIVGTNLGNGSDITNVTLCGVSATNIASQSATQVVVWAGSRGSGATGDVVVYSTSYGATTKANGFSYTGETMRVVLYNIYMQVVDGGVSVCWRTASEENTVGFDLFRWNGKDWVKVNSALIPATGEMGGSYCVADAAANGTDTFVYKLVEIETDGGVQEYGPYEVAASNPRLENLAATPEGVVLRWLSREGDVYGVQKATDVRSGFAPLATGLPATPPVNVHTDATETGRGAYYRVVVE